eukprot:6460993-Pyramimonas_sp.AAC.1
MAALRRALPFGRRRLTRGPRSTPKSGADTALSRTMLCCLTISRMRSDSLAGLLIFLDLSDNCKSSCLSPGSSSITKSAA